MNQPADWPLQGIDRKAFLNHYWQRKPLLLRQAVPGFAPLIPRDALFALAGTEDAESRLVRREGEAWDVEHGPFRRRDLPSVRQPQWTLLVQGVNLLDDSVAALMERFRFVPDARLDDIMISWASDGGGVGPHVDDYDVFLLQAEGTRRWRIGPVANPAMRPGQPLKLLVDFEPEEDLLLEPGDMLYLPPGWGHDGIAVGPCMTYSVGFRAPPAGELLRQLLWKLAEDVEPGTRYSDRGRIADGAAAHPAELPSDMVRFVVDALRGALPGRPRVEAALAEILSEPKQQVWFDPSTRTRAELRRAMARGGVRLDRRSRMLYAGATLAINGEAVGEGLVASPLLRQLADRRRLDAQALAAADAAERDALLEWCAAGWAHPGAM